MTEPDLTGLSDAEVVRRALHPGWVLVKTHAIDELARRAIENRNLLDAASEAIKAEKTVKSRLGPPLGWLGAARILTSDEPVATSHLLREMSSWTADEQQDLMRLVAGPKRLAELTKEFQRKYGWSPKYRY